MNAKIRSPTIKIFCYGNYKGDSVNEKFYYSEDKNK